MPSRRGFTLVECLVVISLIALLISMLLPSLERSRRTVRDAICLSNQREIINGVLTYANDHDQRLPMSGRSWPHMGMLDFFEGGLRRYISRDMKLLHCPVDDANLSSMAAWWRGWYGTPMVAADHIYLQPGEPGEVNYSYYWFVKMYWAVDEATGILKGNHLMQQFRVETIKFPSQLITLRCFVNHGRNPAEFSGMSGAFIDSHAEWVAAERILPSAAPWYGIYNLDWTAWGIRGKDVE